MSTCFGPSLVRADFRGRRYTRATVHCWLFGVFHRREAAAAHDKIHLPAEVSIVAEVAIGAMVGTLGAFGVSVDMAISIPGIDRDADEVLVAKAHEVCPYFNATRGNIDVVLGVV